MPSNSDIISALRLLDDNFMTKVFEQHPECAELVLRIIMNDPNIKIEKTGYQTQYLIKNLQGRSVQLDIHSVDTYSYEYDLEIQRADKGAGAHRARYNSSLMDANQKDSGKYGEKLTDTYVIFITENDVLHKGKAIYKIERYVDGETLFNDGAHIIYVNGAYEDDSTDIGKLMHDFRCSDPDKMNFKLLADRASYFKKTKEGEETMCKMLENMRREAAEQAAEKAETKSKTDSIKALMETMKLTSEQAMNALKIPASEFPKYLAML